MKNKKKKLTQAYCHKCRAKVEVADGERCAACGVVMFDLVAKHHHGQKLRTTSEAYRKLNS